MDQYSHNKASFRDQRTRIQERKEKRTHESENLKKERKEEEEKNKIGRKEEEEKLKKKTKEAQDKIDKSITLLKNPLNVDSSIDVLFQNLEDFVDSSDKSWIQKADKETKEAFFNKLRSETVTNKDFVNRKYLSPSEVVGNTSALTGKLFTNDVNDLAEQRKAVLQAHSGIKLKAPRLSQTEETNEFQSHYQRDLFHKCLSAGGWGTAVDITAADRVKGIGGGYEYENKQKEESEQLDNLSATYFSRLLCSIMPTALWEPQISDVSLSKDALTKLRDIEKYMLPESDLAKTECKRFFKEFGSHVYLRGIHLGGMYKIETNYESNQTTNLTIAKEMVQSKHSEYVNASFGIPSIFTIGFQQSGHQESGKVDANGKFENIESSKVQTTESKVGGPQEVSTLPLWKLGLLSNNCTWVVVDGGKFCKDDYTPVWELVQQQSEDFKNAFGLVQFLIETWENISGMKAQKHDLIKCQIKSIEARLKREIELMTQCLSSEKDASAIAKVVCNLYSQVVEMKRTLGNANIWQDEIQNNSSVSEFLNLVITQDFSKDDEIEVCRCIKGLMKFSRNVETKLQQKITLWLHKKPTVSVSFLPNQSCDNVEEFGSLVKTFLSSYRVKVSERKSYVPHDFTLELGKTIQSLLKKLHSIKDCSQVLYLYSLLIPLKFDVTTNDFEVQVTVKDLEYLNKKLENGLPQYKDGTYRGEKWLQAWILKGLLSDLLREGFNKGKDAFSEGENVLSEYSKVLQLVKNEKLYISDKSVKALIDKRGGDIDSLIESLKFIVDGQNEQYPKTLEWKYFARKNSTCYINDKRGFISKAFDSQPGILTDQRSRRDVPDLVKTLKLSDYFPGKLTVPIALEIDKQTPAQSACIENLPWLMLKTIITGNFQFRENLLDDLLDKVTKTSTSDDGKQTDGNVLDMLEDSDYEGKITDNSDTHNLHPLDILLVLYICCDASLKGLVAQKIFSCQLAIPFIHKDYLSDKNLVVSLWPLRGIVTTSNHTEQSVVTQETTIVSFIRLGESCKMSKSKLLNEILRDQSESHSTFFHRDCKFGMRTRTISDGMVEITWYLPSDDRDRQEKLPKEPLTKHIQQPLTILNMRGDAVKYREQIDVILHMSRIVVVFVGFEDLKNKKYKDLLTKIHASDSYHILFTKMDQDKNISRSVLEEHRKITKMDKSKTYVFSTFDLGLMREYNACETKERLVGVISIELTKTKKTTKLETATEKTIGQVHCDEINKNCVAGKELARALFSAIEKEDNINRKDIFLPLQGERFWRQWSRLQKENKRAGKRQSDEQRDKLWKEMMALREAQVNELNSTSDVVARFVETVIEIIDQEETLFYFLAWLKRFLDDESRSILPNLRKRLHSAFHDYQTKTKKSDSEMTQIEKCKDGLAKASFGLEHVFRELAQIYEAFAYCAENNRNRVSTNTFSLLEILPYLAVKLLLLGQPLELMDGDASNVPQKWIEAVFKALNEVTKKRKVVSISVLGIQSSGKSTLLNTMFGLQFSVSAGRCTRGVFLQLLRICGDNTRKGPSYAIIIDTEGLRAPESSGKTVTYDNELATLVIGLADIIIVTIKGETMGEMENVLQIVVHELLRLKQAHANLALNQSVILVHQNISAQDAASHLDQGNLSIVTNLNRVTKEAASQACMSGIECFKDVIHFNSKDHVKYISDLWLGNPPMAPINPRYCSQAGKVVDAIFHDLVKDQKQFLSVKDTSVHLGDLWDAILQEDFVFSFCSGLQIKAYNLLEDEYLKQKWRLEKVKMEWELDNVKPRLKECKNDKELSKCGLKLTDDFEETLETEKALALKEMNDFLRHSDLKQQMAEWQESKKKRLEDNADELKSNFKSKIRVEKVHCSVALKEDTVIEQRTKCLYEMATAIAKSLQGQLPSDEDKRRHFQDFWRKEVGNMEQEVEEESLQQRKKRIKSEIKRLLYNQFGPDKHLLEKELSEHPLEKPFTSSRLENCLNDYILADHIKILGTFEKMKYYFSSGAHLSNALGVVNLILREIDQNCTNLLKTDIDYDKSQFSRILQTIKQGFEKHNSNDSIQFKLGPALEILVSVQAARFACKMFEELSSKYHDKHSIIQQLQAYRPRALQLFEDILSSKTNEIIAANSLCLEVKDILRERIERTLQNDIEGEIRTKRFANKKHAVIKEVLEELPTLNSFEPLSTYISTPEVYIKQWLEKLTDKIVFEKDKNNSYYELQAKAYLKTLIDTIKHAVTRTTEDEEEKGNDININDWIESFKTLIKKEKLAMKFDAFQHVCEINICNFKDFSSCIQEKLCAVEDELKQEFKDYKASTTVWQDKTPYEAIFESLWGCVAKCPFCQEPCIKSDPNHSKDKGDVHRCIQHRPSGIGGVHYVDSKILLMDSCSYLLYKDSDMRCGHWCHCNTKCAHLHKLGEYKKYQPEWEILPNSDSPSSKYWAWCMVQFSKPLAEKYGYIAPEFPESWSCLTKKDAMDSLSVYS